MGKVLNAKDLSSLALDFCYLERERELKKQGERHHFRFLAVPKGLLGKGISSDVILLYSMMLERMWYSVENGWADEKGRVFVIFTSKEIMTQFDCQSQKCAELIKTLEALQLVEVDRSDKGRANRYFVRLIEEEELSREKNSDNQRGAFENQRGGALKSEEGVLRKSKAIEKELNKPSFELSRKENDLSPVDTSLLDAGEKEDFGSPEETAFFAGNVLSPAIFEDGKKGFRICYDDDLPEKGSQTQEKVQQKADAERMKSLPLVEEVLLDFANRTGWFAKETIRVNQMEVSRAEVEQRLSNLTPQMIRYAAECLDKRGNDLMNPKSYALTALFNAPDTYPLYQSMKLKHAGSDDEWYRELRTKAHQVSARKRELKEAGVA